MRACDNLILNTDSYKASHYRQYPPGTEFVSSYIESRGGDYPKTVFFGLQLFLKDYLLEPVTPAMVEEAETVLKAHGVPFNRAGWAHIIRQHGGYLPVAIEAVAEGSLVETHQVLVQVMNTDPACAWLTSYLETMLLRGVWYPTTVATRSYYCKRVIADFLAETSDRSDTLLFKLHDFGARGTSSAESAAIGGLAHLLNFRGTDTLLGVVAGRRYYHEPMAGFSIPAAEHTTITVWGREGEHDAYANMLKQFAGPGRQVAVVSDSYDLWNAIERFWGGDLRPELESSGGTVILRPDSGDPVTVVLEVLHKLMAIFGYRINQKGYRVLPDYLRVIQGDSVSPPVIRAILQALKDDGLCCDNLSFGMGGELLQRINRDTLRFAMKASAARVGGVWRDVYKRPVTDPQKTSKPGRLALIQEGGRYKTVREEALQGRRNRLETVYRDGRLLKDQTLAEIRARLDAASP